MSNPHNELNDVITCPFSQKTISVYRACAQVAGMSEDAPQKPGLSAFELCPSSFQSKLQQSRYIRFLEGVCRYAMQLLNEALPTGASLFLVLNHRVSHFCTCGNGNQTTCQKYQSARRRMSPLGVPECAPTQLTPTEFRRELRPIVQSMLQLVPEEEREKAIYSLLSDLGFEVGINVIKAEQLS